MTFVSKKQRLRQIALLLFRWIVDVSLMLSCSWCAFGLYYSGLQSQWGRLLLTSIWITLIIFILLKVRKLRVPLLFGFIILIAFLLSLNRPSHSRDWRTVQMQMPKATFRGNTVTVRNMRYTNYRSETDYDVTWYTDSFDLESIKSVDFIVVPFSKWRGLAHTMLTFGFENGKYVALSVESRKEKSEEYTPLRGLFKNYEIMYVAGDERDLIGSRLHIDKSPVYLFPIKADKSHIKALFVAMLESSNRLTNEPEFYHTLHNNCTTRIVYHFEDLMQKKLPLDVRILFPGFADGLIQELGLLAFEGTLDEAREHFLVNDYSALSANSTLWSEAIRK